MRIRTWAAIGFLFLPVLSFGQSTLTFPRAMRPSDFSTTGFAVANPDASAADVTFTLYEVDGKVQGTATRRVAARGQLSWLASELFSGASNAGWTQLTSATAGLQGFWFGGNFDTVADGAEAATSSTELVLPLISPQSEIHIVNTGTEEVTVRLNLLGTDGSDLAEPFPQSIAAKGFFRADMATLFALSDLSLPTHMRITCGCANASPFAATVIARNFVASPSFSIANGVPAASTATTIYFPQLINGPQGAANWKSLLGLTNVSVTSDNEVNITFYSATGATRTIQQTLPRNGAARFDAERFSISGGFDSGWVRVISTSGLPLTGYVAYAETVAAAVTVVPAKQDPEAKLVFAHIADRPPWMTGMALLNANSGAADVQVFAIAQNGTVIGSTGFSLPAGTNTIKLLRELVPQTPTRPSDGGYVFVQSSLPLFGIELFFSTNLQILANVPAASGTAFPTR
jgi:hypothetical protein